MGLQSQTISILYLCDLRKLLHLSILSSEKNSTKNIIKAESSKFFKNISDNNLEKISNEDIVSVGSRKMSPKRKILISKKKNLISDILSDELNNTKKKNEKIVDFPNELNNSRTKKETMKIIIKQMNQIII